MEVPAFAVRGNRRACGPKLLLTAEFQPFTYAATARQLGIENDGVPRTFAPWRGRVAGGTLVAADRAIAAARVRGGRRPRDKPKGTDDGTNRTDPRNATEPKQNIPRIPIKANKANEAPGIHLSLVLSPFPRWNRFIGTSRCSSHIHSYGPVLLMSPAFAIWFGWLTREKNKGVIGTRVGGGRGGGLRWRRRNAPSRPRHVRGESANEAPAFSSQWQRMHSARGRSRKE